MFSCNVSSIPHVLGGLKIFGAGYRFLHVLLAKPSSGPARQAGPTESHENQHNRSGGPIARKESYENYTYVLMPRRARSYGGTIFKMSGGFHRGGDGLRGERDLRRARFLVYCGSLMNKALLHHEERRT
jgi:hypothetical protein